MKTIYDFEVFVEEEVTKTVEKKRKKKNKETGKMEQWTEKVEEKVVEKIPHQIAIKKPTRSQIEEADLFYSIQFNKYIKMGLLTDSQIAKKQIEVGEGLSKDQINDYLKLQELYTQKEEMLYRTLAINEKEGADEEREKRKNSIISDMLIIENKMGEYKKMQISAYNHTSDSRASMDCLLWWILHLTYFRKGDSETEEYSEMFEGANYSTKQERLNEMEEDGGYWYKLLEASYRNISEIVSVWFYLKLETKEDISATIEQMNKIEDKNAEKVPA